VIGTGAGNMRALGGADAPPASIQFPITAPPTLTGKHGRAWSADLAAGRRKMRIDVSQDATLVHWIIEAPWAHPAWHSYSLVLVHLRPMADRRETRFYLDGATHEFWLYALNPETDHNDTVETGISRGWLHPKNFAAQFIEISDDLALERIERSVQMICDGKLSPDTDWQQAWVDLYGNNMIKREYR
jgi:hypothetical protein